ncbi:hypothetical protein ACFL3Z_02925, partial [Gemmatimonadota bacterium]
MTSRTPRTFHVAFSALQYRGYGGGGAYVESLLGALAGLDGRGLRISVIGHADQLERLESRVGTKGVIEWVPFDLSLTRLQIARILKYSIPGARMAGLEEALLKIAPDVLYYPQQDVLCFPEGIPTAV